MVAGKSAATPLLQYRVARNLSQADVAKKAGLSRITVGRIERGEEKPWPRTAQAIADALEFPVSLVFPAEASK